MWLTSYHGEKAFHYNGHDITVSPPSDAPADILGTPHGVLATFVIGYLAFKVLGINQGMPSPADPQVLLKIWPISEGSVEWPTVHTITNESLAAFENMFLI